MQSRPVFVKFSSLQYVLLAFPSYVLTCNKAGRHFFVNFGQPTHWTSCMPFLIHPLHQLMTPSTSLDFILTFVSVVFNYAGPFFLKSVDILSIAFAPVHCLQTRPGRH